MIRRNQIWKIYGTNFKEMTKELLAETDLAGKIREARGVTGEVRSGAAAGVHGDRRPAAAADVRIGIKPNLVVASPAEFGGTTHPEVIAGIIEYLQEQGFSNLVIAEGSWVGDRTADAFRYCGYEALSGEYGVPLIDTQKVKWHAKDCAGMKLNLVDTVDEIDFLINVPVLKGHCQTKVTCALKNMKGLLPNSEKSRFHRMGLHKPIAHLNTAIRPDFIVVDHICGDLDFEEGGNPVVRNCVMAALDPVLVDSYACYLMHYTPDDVPYIRMAEALGVGTTDLDSAEIFNMSDGNGDEELPRERRILDVSYAVNEVDSCSACYGSLIPALFRLKEEGLLDRLHEKIGIGQGLRGKTGALGVGRCTKDFDFCIMGCPPDEETIYQKLRQYIEGNAGCGDSQRT